MTAPLALDSSAVAIAAGGAMFLALLSVMRALAPVDNVAARARSHARRRDQLRAAWLAPRDIRRRKTKGIAKRVVQRLKRVQSKEEEEASGLLVQAGWRSPEAVIVFLAVRIASPVVLALAFYILAPSLVEDITFTTHVAAGVAGIAAGGLLPKMLLKNVGKRRHQKVLKGLPEALDLLVICAEAGLSLDAAIKRVAREIGPSWPEMADEFGLSAVELGFLPDRRKALGNLAKRTPIAEIEALVNTLAQTEKYGTPLAQALRVLSQEFRSTRMMRAEQKAARLPAVLTVPMIVFILPPLFIILIGPAIVQALLTVGG
ncbi:type II secretion system F family protein [Altericroceibacterium xinjiangense]|uniref:type II secretion system F family protein n=1 Tax=Altericroceibacterium xinjiangense TaxID=762261 RepID=UPI000F7DF617|nr:type II secretion system F family protein [Altericroceibacterium xinjiangense]